MRGRRVASGQRHPGSTLDGHERGEREAAMSEIRTRPVTPEYEAGHEAVFGKRERKEPVFEPIFTDAKASEHCKVAVSTKQ